ncbi:hypothetical protein JHK84_048046 [Glycine max]|nr:hypothetical protein JHK85_048634 [Glycine max]KAG5103077.1 hypothetical protein JHK84_048046 [Glycine max]
MELENCYYAFDIKENEDMVLISAEQLRVKDKSIKTMAQAAQQHSLLEEELKQQKKKLEESSEVDVANGKQRHIPYKDSRLTFLLQVDLYAGLV